MLNYILENVDWPSYSASSDLSIRSLLALFVDQIICFQDDFNTGLCGLRPMLAEKLIVGPCICVVSARDLNQAMTC